MTQFLLLFSLILHGVTFVIIVFAFKHFKDKQGSGNVQQTIREVEDLFESYILELKDENEKLLNILNKNGKNVKVTSSNQPEKNSSNEVHSIDVVLEREKSINRNERKDVDEEYKPEIISFEDKVEEPSLHGSVLSLHSQGMSIDEIAKKLNVGKTEVELIIKFHVKS